MIKGNLRSRRIDMVHEKPFKAIVLFAVPLLLGNLLQQLYNTVDSVVVGNLVGSTALAAVGTSAPITQLLLGFFLGMSASASILVSQAMGKADPLKLERLIHTSIVLALLAGIVIGGMGMAFTPALLRLLNTPANVFDMACDYMRVSLAGIVTVMLFNVINGILQGIGDSKTPLMILVICNLMNVLLDLLFVSVFHMSMGGVALATVISQGMSVAFGIVRMNRSGFDMQVRFSKLRIDWMEMRAILKLGFPAGLQQSLDSIGNLLVQGVINSFGAVIMAANIAVIKLDSFCTMPMMTFATAITVFVGQNMGAKRMDRVAHGTRVALLMSFGMSLVISLLLVIGGPAMLQLFTQEADVVQAGMDKVRILAPFYFCMGVWVILSGVVRGSGEAFVSMIVGVLSMFLVRVPIAFLLPRAIGANGIHWSLAIVWFVEAACITLYYLLYFRRKRLACGSSLAGK